MLFDAHAAKRLAAGSHIVVQGCPGLRLEASATRKTWVYRYRSTNDGRLRQVKIGGWPALSLPQAVARWQELREARDAGREPADEKRQARAPAAEPAPYTVGAMVEDYAAGYLASHREPKGARATTARIRRATSSLAHIPAAEITRAQVFELIRSLEDRPVVARSVKAEMAAAFRLALEAGRLPGTAPNWWAERTSLKLRSKGALRDGVRKGTTKRVLSAAEIHALMTRDLLLFSQQVRDFLTLQLWTCTRGAEICAMRREHIANEGGRLWWTVPKGLQKNRHAGGAVDLRVPLFGRAEDVVQRLLMQPGSILFPSRSRDGVIGCQSQAYMQSKVHYHQPYSKSRPDHVRSRLTVTHWSPHDLRRTGRTMLAALGCPHEAGEAILGHVLPGVAGDYNLYRYDAERAHWLAALDRRLTSIVTGV